MVVFDTTIMYEKERKVLSLFFEEPLKKFSFTELVRRSGLHKDNVNNWLKRFLKEQLIKKIIPEIKKVVEEVNSLSLNEQKSKLKELGFEVEKKKGNNFL